MCVCVRACVPRARVCVLGDGVSVLIVLVCCVESLS